MYISIYIYIHTRIYPPPCRRHRCVLKLTPKAPVTISNHLIHPVPFAVGVWRSSCNRSLEFQLKSESGVSSLEICRAPPLQLHAVKWIATLLRLPIPPCSRLFRVCRLISSSCYVILPPICPNIAQDSPKSSILEPTSSIFFSISCYDSILSDT